MALVGCTCCESQRELPIAASWLCGCGAGWWGTHVIEYSLAEIDQAFRTLRETRNRIGSEVGGAVIPSAVPICGIPEGSINAGGKIQSLEAFVDTLLLFFPSVILRDHFPKKLIEALGERKFTEYHDAGLLRTVTTYREFADKGCDLDLADALLPDIKRVWETSLEEELSAYWIMFNMVDIYTHDIVRALIDNNLIDSCRSSDGHSFSLGSHSIPLVA